MVCIISYAPGSAVVAHHETKTKECGHRLKKYLILVITAGSLLVTAGSLVVTAGNCWFPGGSCLDWWFTVLVTTFVLTILESQK